LLEVPWKESLDWSAAGDAAALRLVLLVAGIITEMCWCCSMFY
jgi:hypothetical protein